MHTGKQGRLQVWAVLDCVYVCLCEETCYSGTQTDRWGLVVCVVVGVVVHTAGNVLQQVARRGDCLGLVVGQLDGL